MCVSRIMIMKHYWSVQNRDTANTENSTSSSLLVKLCWDGSLPYIIWLWYRTPCTAGCNENMNFWSWKLATQKKQKKINSYVKNLPTGIRRQYCTYFVWKSWNSKESTTLQFFDDFFSVNTKMLTLSIIHWGAKKLFHKNLLYEPFLGGFITSCL